MAGSGSKLLTAEAREFTQARSQRTYEALIEAGAEVFAEVGFDATQTPEIAARAGVSVGTFYRYFKDKKEIFIEILRRHLATARDEVLADLEPERFVGVGKRATIEAAIGVLLENVRSRPGLHRAYLEMSLRDPEIAALRDAFDREAHQYIAALIAAICRREEVADPEATAYIIQTSVVECATAISRGPTVVSAERSLAALTELVYRALFGIE
jgi:AcrR family transcriptional regulator